MKVDKNGTYTFPIAFPSNCASISSSQSNKNEALKFKSLSQTGFTVTCDGGSPDWISIIAIGY